MIGMDSETQVIYQELKKVAVSGTTTHYSDIGFLIGLDMGSPADRNRIARILDDISRLEHARGNPLLSAVVLLREKNIPGDGFFKLAKSLSKQGTQDDFEFWLHEVKRVHDIWATKV